MLILLPLNDAAGDKAIMRLRRRGRILKVLIACLTCSTVLLLFLNFWPVLRHEKSEKPVVIKEITKDTYALEPTYEYTSIYRKYADQAFEVLLETKLIVLEQQLRGDEGVGEGGLAANRTIWQVASSTQQAKKWEPWITQWRINNDPEWTHELFLPRTPPTLPPNLLPIFASIPEISYAMDIYPSIHTDLLKYLILWYHGGLYSKPGSWNRVSLRSCAPFSSVLDSDPEPHHKISLMLGIQIDEPYFSQETVKARNWTRGFSFGDDTIWAPLRFDPIMRKAIIRTISHAAVHEALNSHFRPKSHFHLNSHFRNKNAKGRKMGKKHELPLTPELSGAGMLTDLTLDFLSQTLPQHLPQTLSKSRHKIQRKDPTLRDQDAGLEKRVTWKHFKGLRDVLWIYPDTEMETDGSGDWEGLAILPINVFGSGQDHSHSGDGDTDEACVNGLYE